MSPLFSWKHRERKLISNSILIDFIFWTDGETWRKNRSSTCDSRKILRKMIIRLSFDTKVRILIHFVTTFPNIINAMITLLLVPGNFFIPHHRYSTILVLEAYAIQSIFEPYTSTCVLSSDDGHWKWWWWIISSIKKIEKK